MGAGPFGHGARVARHTLVQAGLRRQRGKHVRQRTGIIAGRGEVADAQIVRLIFLAAREFEGQKLAAGADPLLQHAAQRRIAQQGAGQHLQQRAADRVALRRLLAPLAMLGGDMADFMAQHAGQLRLVIHQRHQLARDIDIAAGDGEGVVDGRIEQGDGEITLRIGEAGLDRDAASDRFHIARLRPDIGAAKFLEQFGMLLGTRCLVLRADRGDGANRPLLPQHRRRHARDDQADAKAGRQPCPIHSIPILDTLPLLPCRNERGQDAVPGN